jgi:uncharacterized protein YeaO (DUF488 family)
MSRQNIAIKRIYEEPEPDDGVRVLVDRLWPRGIKKENASIDFWLKEVAPSDQLRKWFQHEPEKFPEFRQHYEAELHTREAGSAGKAAPTCWSRTAHPGLCSQRQ